MTSLYSFSLLTCATVLAAALAGCGDSSETLAASSSAQASRTQPAQCRSADAQSTQKGCRPIGQMVGRK